MNNLFHPSLFRNLTLAAAGIASLVLATAANATIILSDSFNRSNSTSLGSNNNAIGGTLTGPYIEQVPGSGASGDVASITSNRLRIFGGTSNTSDPGVAILNVNLPADISMSVEARSDLTNPTVGQTFRNTWLFQLRRPDTTSTYPALNGMTDVIFAPNGQLFVRYWSGGSPTTLFDDNPFISGTQSLDWSIKPGGTLGTTYNGLPFDVDNDGTLELDEQITLGVKLQGTTLDVLLNGAILQTITGLPTPGANNYLALVKQRISSGNNINTPYVEYDNLVIDNLVITPPVPEPSSFLLLGAGALGMVRQVRRRRSGRV